MYSFTLAFLIVSCRGLSFRATTSGSPIDSIIRNGAHIIGHPDNYFTVCGAYDQLSTPAIFKVRPRGCQIVTYGCSCINSRAYFSNASAWSISSLFNECFITRIPPTETTVAFTWISSVSKLSGTMCDISELTYMYTDNAEGVLTVTFIPFS
jgi:hypothetical protein